VGVSELRSDIFKEGTVQSGQGQSINLQNKFLNYNGAVKKQAVDLFEEEQKEEVVVKQIKKKY